jgi:hypothetical protein
MFEPDPHWATIVSELPSLLGSPRGSSAWRARWGVTKAELAQRLLSELSKSSPARPTRETREKDAKTQP